MLIQQVYLALEYFFEHVLKRNFKIFYFLSNLFITMTTTKFLGWFHCIFTLIEDKKLENHLHKL